MDTNQIRSLGQLRGAEFADQQADEVHNLWGDDEVASLHEALDSGDYDAVHAALGEPAPLSGEWAGESIPELFDGVWPSDDDLSAYEGEWFAAWSNRLESRVAEIHRGRLVSAVMADADERGRNAAVWVSDDFQSRSFTDDQLEQIAAGDLETFGYVHPSPLSGEWAGESLAEIFDVEPGTSWPNDDVLAEYEGTFFSAWEETITAAAASALRNGRVNDVRDLNAHQLARRAGCVAPDSLGSTGARFLTLVRDSVVERVEYDVDDVSDAAHEIADGCVPVYTHQAWLTFVDLAAYQEDPSDLTGEAQQGDMTQAAMTCLYLVGQRLAHALFDELGFDA